MTCTSSLTLNDLADRSAGHDSQSQRYLVCGPGRAASLRGTLCGLRELASSILTW